MSSFRWIIMFIVRDSLWCCTVTAIVSDVLHLQCRRCCSFWLLFTSCTRLNKFTLLFSGPWKQLGRRFSGTGFGNWLRRIAGSKIPDEVCSLGRGLFWCFIRRVIIKRVVWSQDVNFRGMMWYYRWWLRCSW